MQTNPVSPRAIAKIKEARTRGCKPYTEPSHDPNVAATWFEGDEEITVFCDGTVKRVLEDYPEPDFDGEEEFRRQEAWYAGGGWGEGGPPIGHR